MKNKKVLTLLLVMLMVCSTAVAAYVPAFNAGLNASKNTGTTATTSAGLNDGVTVTDVSDKYDTSVVSDALNKDALLTLSDVAKLTGDETPVFSSEDEVWVIVQLSDDSLVTRYNEGRIKIIPPLTHIWKARRLKIRLPCSKPDKALLWQSSRRQA